MKFLMSVLIAYFMRLLFWDNYIMMSENLSIIGITLQEEQFWAASWLATLLIVCIIYGSITRNH